MIRLDLVLVVFLIALSLWATSACNSLANDTEAKAMLSGRMLSGPGTASRESAVAAGVAGQTVTIIDSSTGNAVASTVTASDGSFQVSLRAGSYEVQGGGDRRLVHLRPGEQVQLNLALPVP